MASILTNLDKLFLFLGVFCRIDHRPAPNNKIIYRVREITNAKMDKFDFVSRSFSVVSDKDFLIFKKKEEIFVLI